MLRQSMPRRQGLLMSDEPSSSSACQCQLDKDATVYQVSQRPSSFAAIVSNSLARFLLTTSVSRFEKPEAANTSPAGLPERRGGRRSKSTVTGLG
jgi:hypothetical protein